MYDFDEIVDRRGSGSLKWDVADDELPMWVADMDFKTCPDIIEAISERTRHGIFGYSIIPDEWNSAYVSWWKERHNYEIDPESLIFCTGVVPAISSCVRKLTTPGENVVILTPVYNVFFNSIFNNGVNVLQCPLKYENYEYSIDFGRFEEAVADPQTTLLIFCNPHNPCGKIWDRQTLAKVGSLCKKYNVNIISDEIHCDLTDPDKKYIPFAGISNHDSITTISPTKSFNIAGLNTAAVYIVGDKLKEDVFNALDVEWVSRANIFAINAAIAAYNNGRPWLDELRQYLYDNKKFAADFIKKEIPEIKLTDADATYLLWLDCSDLDISSEEFIKFLNEKTGVLLSAGVDFGKNSDEFLRLNIACPRQLLEKGLKAIKKGVAIYKQI